MQHATRDGLPTRADQQGLHVMCENATPFLTTTCSSKAQETLENFILYYCNGSIHVTNMPRRHTHLPNPLSQIFAGAGGAGQHLAGLRERKDPRGTPRLLL
jgi:hypothetical protein